MVWFAVPSSAFAATPTEPDDALVPTVAFTLSGGAATLGGTPELAVGAELGLRLSYVELVAGLDEYSSRRILSPARALETGLYSTWQSVWPVTFGALYSPRTG